MLHEINRTWRSSKDSSLAHIYLTLFKICDHVVNFSREGNAFRSQPFDILSPIHHSLPREGECPLCSPVAHCLFLPVGVAAAGRRGVLGAEAARGRLASSPPVLELLLALHPLHVEVEEEVVGLVVPRARWVGVALLEVGRRVVPVLLMVVILVVLLLMLKNHSYG